MPISNEKRSYGHLWHIGVMVAVVIWSTGCVVPVFSGGAIPFEAFVDTTPTDHYPEHEPETLATPLPESAEVIVVTYYVQDSPDGSSNELVGVELVRPSGHSVHYPLRMGLTLIPAPGSFSICTLPSTGMLAFADGYWPRHRTPEKIGITSSPEQREFRLAMYPRSCGYNDFVALEAGLREGNVGYRRYRGLAGPKPSDGLRLSLWPVLARDHEKLIHLIETDKDLTQTHRTMVFRQLIELLEAEIASRRGAGPDVSALTDEVIADLREAIQRVTPSPVAAGE